MNVPKWATFGAIVAGATGEGKDRLESMCELLQRAWGERPFPLDQRTAGVFLHRSHVTVGKWIRQLCGTGRLHLVSRGSHSRRRASEYFYLGRRA